jgi:hypothetical protein
LRCASCSAACCSAGCADASSPSNAPHSCSAGRRAPAV